MKKKVTKLFFTVFFISVLSSNTLFSQVITTLATGLSNPNSIVTDSSFVYWIEYGSGTVKRVPNNGGSVTTLATGLVSPTGIALDSVNVYFGENYGLNSARIKRAPKTGGSVATIVNNLYSISQLCMDNVYIYFSDFNGNQIQQIPKIGGTVVTLSTQTTSPTKLVLDNSNVYWTEFTNPGAVKKVPKTGGATVTLAFNSNSLGIAIDNNFVYWTENVYTNQGKVNKVPLNGGASVTLAQGLNNAWDLCIDNYNAYWVEDRTNGAVKQVAFSDTSEYIFTNSAAEPVAITSDAIYIYWIERNGGTNGSLKKSAKLLTGITPISTSTPDKFSLSQNYPNPFNPATKVKFDIPKQSIVQIKIYDLLGREIAELVNQQINPGTYEITWDASNYSSGIYFYKLTAGSFTDTKKMVLIK
jgi:hypothetical protein